MRGSVQNACAEGRGRVVRPLCDADMKRRRAMTSTPTHDDRMHNEVSTVSSE